MSRLLHRIGGSAARHPWRALAAWLVALIVVLGLAGTVGGALNDNYTIPGTGSQRSYDLLKDRFPQMSGADARAVVHSDQARLDPARLAAARTQLADVRGASSVSPPVLSADGRTALLTVQYDVPVTDFSGDEGLVDLQDATTSLRRAGYQVEFGGQVPENVSAPDGKAEAVGLVAAIVILLLAFGSLVAAGLPLLVALIGLGIGTGGVTLLAAFTDVSTISPTLASMIGIGVGIDYALFIVTRHRDNLARGMTVPEAAANANATAGQSVVFAGGTVLLALLGLQFTGIPNFASMGYATGIVVLVTVLAAVTLLPAVLGLLGMRVYSRKARRSGRFEASASHSPTAARLAHAVNRRPVAWLGAALLLLLALAAPALGLRIGQSDAGNEPESNTVRRAYDLVTDAYGAGSNAPLVVAVDVDKLGGPAELAVLEEQLAQTPDVLQVSPAQFSADKSAAVLTVTPATGPQDERTLDLLAQLRDTAPAGVEVGGFTAAMVDLSDVLSAHLWLVIAVVIATSFVLLVLAFRSIVVPIKAAVVNLLSVGAAYGVVALMFQTKAGASFLGLPGEVPVAAYVPVLMFAILFGLSMDYEVFLLSRIREEYLRTGDSRGSVVAGLSSTARVISSAALIMVAVFLGFALDPSVVVKMMGIGLATAIAIDATVVRLVLVPATMALLGNANWYIPRWLDRVLPNLDPHGAEGTISLPQPRTSPEDARVPVGAGQH
jgi:RND superfamily putative drug exporter